MSAVHRVRPVTLRFPLWRYLPLFPGGVLLDSAREQGGLGRWSMLVPPGGRRLTVSKSESTTKKEAPWSRLRDFGAPRLPVERLAAELPFVAGAVGWIGYEAGWTLEALPPPPRDDLGLPLMDWRWSDVVVLQDHQTDRAYVSAVGWGDTDFEADARAQASLSRWAQPLSDPPPALVPWPAQPAAISADFDRDGYAALVRAAQEEILAGNIFQVCLTHRLRRPWSGDPFALYAHLRALNPAPFAAFFPTDRGALLSSSPERFLSLDRGQIAESRPIKGTRPRAEDPLQDATYLEALRNSNKDRAENVMIVDLVRNDLGRVAIPGTVQVPQLQTVESYATVHQLVSTVRAQLPPDLDAVDLLQATFPGGSMTGAPKIEAMKIAARLEPRVRGVYSGALGYWDCTGAMDLSMVIRSILLHDGTAHVGVGGGVVFDSDPVAEYQETLDKAAALLRALEGPCGS